MLYVALASIIIASITKSMYSLTCSARIANPRYRRFEKYIKQNTITKTTILLKGSRGMQLERILDFL